MMADDTQDAERYRFLRDSLFRMHSPKMNGQHSWTVQGGGWLRLRGPNLDDAVDAAMKKLRDETVDPGGGE